MRGGEKKVNSKHFLSYEVTLFKSYRKAKEYICNFMSEEDLARFAAYAEGESKVNRTSSYEWTEDPSLPKGWKSRLYEAKKFYLAPTGEQFPVRRLALKFMVENYYPVEDLEKTRISLGEEGWKESPLLPEGWRFRKKEHRSGPNRGSMDFLTKEGVHFKSFKTTREYAEANCSQTDVAKLDEFAVEESRKNRLTEVGYNWEEDESLPEGWKLRHIKGPKGKVFYLAPNGDSFPTRQSALRFLIQNDMRQSDIEKMREGLHCENWHSHNLLPKGWKMRSSEKNTKVFLTKEAKFISGYKQAAIFINESKKLSKGDADRSVEC